MNFHQKRLIKAARIKFNRIHSHISKSDSLIDIGMGNGALTSLLLHSHYNVKGLDIANKSKFKKAQPIVYDGATMPFKDKEFDLALLITMLHHTPDPDQILIEAKRVSKRIIIIEDTFKNKLQLILTKFMDSLVNWEFKGHPHTNRSNHEWLNTFKKLGLKVEFKKERPFLIFFRQATYVLSTS